MASRLGLRYLFTATRRGMNGERVARASLMSRSSSCHPLGCYPPIEIKPSVMLLYPNGHHHHHNHHHHNHHHHNHHHHNHHHHNHHHRNHCFTTSAAYPKIGECEVQIVSDGKELQVVWPGDGGEKSTYHATWLKHGCHCPLCWEEATTQHLVWDCEPDPSEISISRAIPTGSVEVGELDITWSFAEGEGHRGSIPLKWLQENSYSPEALKREREAIIPSLATSLPTVSYSDARRDERYVWKWLKTVNVYGVCLLTDVPTDLGTVMQAADLSGGVLETLYDKIYDVLSVENPIDVAYTCSGLPMHMDLAYYESQPGLQFLHCIRNDSCVVGGENVLLDLWAVAEQLQREHPKHFDTLTRVRVTFQRIHFDRDRPVALKRGRPHFMLDANEDLTAFYWNEGTQGPLLAPADEVEAYFEARHCLKTALANSTLKLTHKLQPGEALVFNNRRLLHTRTSYSLNGGVRHLQGAYVGIDDFMSKVRMLAMKYEPDFHPKRSFGLDPM